MTKGPEFAVGLSERLEQLPVANCRHESEVIMAEELQTVIRLDDALVRRMQAEGPEYISGVAEGLRAHYERLLCRGGDAISYPERAALATKFGTQHYQHLVEATEAGTLRHASFSDHDYVHYLYDVVRKGMAHVRIYG